MLNGIRNSVLAGAMVVGLPTAAFAHHHGFHMDVVVPGPEFVVPAQPSDGASERVWVPAVYRSVTQRVWVEPVTTIKVQRIEVPAQYETRDILVRDYYGHRHIRREQVLICPAHCEDQSVPLVVCPGHFEDQTHQEEVCEGHWESRCERPVTVIRPVPADIRLEIPLPF